MRLEVRGVHKRYRGTVACSDVSCTFDDEVVGILGPNGAGKSTLLAMAAGELRTDAGTVYVGDHALSTSAGRQAARGDIGYLPQRFDLVGSMRVGAFVRYAGWCQGLTRSSLEAASTDALERVDLQVRARDRVRSLSGGQRQRLGLAACLSHRPSVLILDEPTVGLDPEQRAAFGQLLRMAALPPTIVIATHLIEDLRRVADRILVMNRGSVIFNGTPSSLGRLGGRPDEPDDLDLQRGYMHVLASDRQGSDS